MALQGESRSRAKLPNIPTKQEEKWPVKKNVPVKNTAASSGGPGQEISHQKGEKKLSVLFKKSNKIITKTKYTKEVKNNYNVFRDSDPNCSRMYSHSSRLTNGINSIQHLGGRRRGQHRTVLWYMF